MFNPFAHRDARGLDFITDFGRVNHRTHNKLMVMDNAMAIVGGRNIGDHYFQVHTEANFRDLDVAAAGPVVREISAVFDHFWNGEWAVPISALVDQPYTETDPQAALGTMRERIAAEDYPYPLDQDTAALESTLKAEIDRFIWAPGELLREDPVEIVETGGTSRMLEAPHGRGVCIRVLTNSPGSNGVLAAHAGCAGRRKQARESGVDLYAPHADAGSIKKRIAFAGAKAVVFDQKDVLVGSFGKNPESTAWQRFVAGFLQILPVQEQL
jgi:putative cardiolipin synthase